MLSKDTLSRELELFASTGWMDYVLACDSWLWEGGRIEHVSATNVLSAYELTRQRLHANFVRNRNLYRTLLLAPEFDVSSLSSGSQDFGRFWTASSSCASEFVPRRRYQDTHPMPDGGVPYVIVAGPFQEEEIDWVATVGLHLSNPFLEEVRVHPGVSKAAINVYAQWPETPDEDAKWVNSTPPVPGIVPIPEGPGFIENFKALMSAEGIRYYNTIWVPENDIELEVAAD